MPTQANEGSRQPWPTAIVSKPLWGFAVKLQFYGLCSLGFDEGGEESLADACHLWIVWGSFCISGKVSPQHAVRSAVGWGVERSPITTVRHKGPKHSLTPEADT